MFGVVFSWMVEVEKKNTSVRMVIKLSKLKYSIKVY